MTSRRVRFMTVRGPAGSVDVVAAADASLVYLTQLLVEAVGGGELPGDNPRWNLYDHDRRPLQRTGTLVSQDVVDGDVLVLSSSGPPALEEDT